MKTVLVTGVGAIMGYGILRSLRATGRKLNLVGLDIYPDAAGREWCDIFEKAVPVANADYTDFLCGVINRHRVDLVIPGIEQDVIRMSQDHEILSKCGARFALNNPDLVRLSSDKWLTHNKLKSFGFPTIPTVLAEDPDWDFDRITESFGLPLLLKPRSGYASKGIVKVTSRNDFDFWRPQYYHTGLIQKIVGRDDEEYTVGVFGTGDGNADSRIVLQRRLAQDGSTAKARVRFDTALDNVVNNLVAHLLPVGSTNFQFRRHEGTYFLLEVNPRVSSSTSIRTAFGYNESEMTLDYYLDGKKPILPHIRSGSAVRYIEEVVRYDCDHF